MSTKKSVKVGVRIDSYHATNTGNVSNDNYWFNLLARLRNGGTTMNPDQRSGSNRDISFTHSYFKQIAAWMTNLINVLVTGSPQLQEQFPAFTPQYIHAGANENISGRISEKRPVTSVDRRFY